jgi:myo-inositol-1(or 4)-monophosphatase
MTSYSFEYNFIKKVAVEAAMHCIPTNISDVIEVSHKGEGRFDLVTSVDYSIEKFIIDRIKQEFPTDDIISEETNNKQLGDSRTWVIDPLDGTVNFSKGFPMYGIQIAFMHNFEPKASVIYLPEFQKEYSALAGHGAYLNGVKLNVKPEVELENAIITMGDFSKSKDYIQKNQYRMEKFNSFVNEIGKVKMFGSSCYDFACLSQSLSDIFLMFSKNIWDIAPGYLLTKEAGAVISDVDGKPFVFNSSSSILVSVNTNIHEKLVQLLK